MSRLWRNEIRIVFTPQRIALVRVTSGLKPKATDRVSIPVASQGDASWQASVQTLDRVLAEPRWHNSDAVVVVSNQFIHFEIVEWNAALETRAEHLAFARHRFNQIHGDAALRWRVMLDQPGYGKPGVAAAADGEMIESIQRIASHRKISVRSLQPHLMAGFNHWRKTVRQPSFWFVASEPGRTVLLLAQDRQWRRVVSRQTGADWVAETQRIVAREAQVGEPERARCPIWIHAPESASHDLAQIQDSRMRVLKPAHVLGLSGERDREFAMAALT